MTQFMLLSILAIAGIVAQPLLFSRESLDTGQERTGDQLTAMKLETAAVPVGLKYVVCPGGRYQCRDGQTCCRSGDKWACCPYPKVHCLCVLVAIFDTYIMPDRVARKFKKKLPYSGSSKV